METELRQSLTKTDTYWFFLMVNTQSGGGWGKHYLSLKSQQFQFKTKNDIDIRVSIHDLLDSESKLRALQKAHDLHLQSNNYVRFVICGGDGTVLWVIQEVSEAKIDIENVVFTVIPIGTGNDFSRSTGGGHSPLAFSDKNLKPLKKRLIEWVEADVSYYDIWEARIKTYQTGEIAYAKNKEDFWTGKTRLTKGFANYLGIGVDARVSYAFQMNRQSTRCMNLMVYICCGLANLCKGIQELSESFESFKVSNGKEGTKASSGWDPKTQKNEDINLKKGEHGLVFLNSLTYMGGVKNVWNKQKVSNSSKHNQFRVQAFNDGKIEVLSFKNQLSLALQAISHTGKRVDQSQGPFHIAFKPQTEAIETFVQIDGQGLKATHIKEICIQKNPILPNGRIKILTKKTF